jgi:hypothetical protein
MVQREKELNNEPIVRLQEMGEEKDGEGTVAGTGGTEPWQ